MVKTRDTLTLEHTGKDTSPSAEQVKGPSQQEMRDKYRNAEVGAAGSSELKGITR